MPQTNAEIIAAEPGVWIEVDGKLVPDYDATLIAVRRGGRASRARSCASTATRSSSTSATSREGVIPISELSIRRNVDPSEEVALGDEVDALVIRRRTPTGRLILSKKRARFEKAWRRIEEAAESGEAVEGLVIEVVKGGLIIDLGVRGFLPASLVDIRRVQDLDEYLRPDAALPRDRAQPLAQQRRAVAPRGARGGAPRGAPAHPRHARRRAASWTA